MHKFNPLNKERLEKAERENFFDIPAALADLGIKAGIRVADIGAGTGFFSRRICKIVGSSGKVYAVDISKELLLEVQKLGILNIETVQSLENDIPLESGSIDFCFLALIVHELFDPQKFFLEIKRILAPEGKIGIIEWEKVESSEGPSYQDRISETQMRDLLEKNGMRDIIIKPLGKEHYSVSAGGLNG